MGVRLIAGRAGSGKTHWCLGAIRAELAASGVEGPRLVLLVPEQAALQMERALLCGGGRGLRTLGRCEVLSFRRLAHRVLSEAAGHAATPLSPIGRMMVLRHLLGKHRGEMREFGGVSARGGFVWAIARSLTELIQESVSREAMGTAVAAAGEAGDPSADRLHDVALLYGAYLDYLGEGRIDPEGVLDAARERLGKVDWPSGAKIWIDGFAGLSRQQIRMIAALAERAAAIQVALLMDPRDERVGRPELGPDDVSLFARTERTWSSLAEAVRAAGVAIEPAVLLEAEVGPRFGKSAMLGRLERRLFAVPDARHSEEGAGRGSDGSAKSGAAAGAGPDVQGPDDWPPGGVRLVQAGDRRTEVAAAVRAILDLVQRPVDPLRYRDVSIVVRDLTAYHDLISSGLGACGIKFFIDRRRPTHHHAVVQFVRACLSMHSEGAFDRCVVGMLKSGLAGLGEEDADRLENYVLGHGLVSLEAWREAWGHGPRGGEDEGELSEGDRIELAAIQAARAKLLEGLGDWLPGADRRTGQPACRTWIGRLYGVLERFGIARRLEGWIAEARGRGELDEAEEHEQVWVDLMKLLDEAAAALGDERMSGERIRETIESALAEFTLGLVPATIDQVLVGSIERSRHPAVRAVFLLGFADGEFPARSSDDQLLGDEERALLARSSIELSRTRDRQLLDERMLAYVAVTRPSELLWISYPAMDDGGREMRASPYWSSVRAALPEARIEQIVGDEGPMGAASVGEMMGGVARGCREWAVDPGAGRVDAGVLALYEWARRRAAIRPALAATMASLRPAKPAALGARAAAMLWPGPYRTSVTALEMFARCPFQHFSARGLRLRPRAIHEMGGIEWGRLYHVILEQFVNELMETGESLGELSPASIAERIGRICESAVPKFAETMRLEEPERRAAIRRGRRELPSPVAAQKGLASASALRPVAVERLFGGGEELPALRLTTASGKVVELRGKIDRVDILRSADQTLAVVFDYKRRLGQRLMLDEAFHGLALQLLAYLLVLRESGDAIGGAELTPGGAFYVPLLGGFAKVDHPSEAEEAGFDALKAYRPRGVVDFDAVGALDPGLENGRSGVVSAYRKVDGTMGDEDRSDALRGGLLGALLDHTRERMGELAEGWLSGDIAVAPVRIGTDLACTECRFRSVCRFEYSSRQARALPRMGRGEVSRRLEERGGDSQRRGETGRAGDSGRGDA